MAFESIRNLYFICSQCEFLAVICGLVVMAMTDVCIWTHRDLRNYLVFAQNIWHNSAGIDFIYEHY